MRTVSVEAQKKLVEIQKKLGYMANYLEWSPLVGFALNAIQRQFPPAVGGVAGSTVTLESDKGGYNMKWNKNGNRLTINHHGHWKSESVSGNGKSRHLMSKGKIPPLHDESWVDAMRAMGHGHTYPEAAVRFFAELLPVKTSAAKRVERCAIFEKGEKYDALNLQSDLLQNHDRELCTAMRQLGEEHHREGVAEEITLKAT
jgi:hypothetical protein